jgi:hypothetical protein
VAEPKDFDEILSNCLAALERGEGLADVLARYPQEASELKPLLEAAVWFAGQKAAVEPRPGFIRASRSRLIEKIEAEPVAAAGGWLEQVVAQLRSALGGSWRVALQVALAVVLLACLVLTGSEAALASQGALPGEALYSIKLSLEKVELLVTLDPAQKIELHNQFAQARLVEIQDLVMEGRYNYIREAVSNFEAHVQQASRLLSALASKDPERATQLALALKETLASQRSFLTFLLAAAPREVAPELLRAIGIAASGEIAVQAAADQAGGASALAASATPAREDAAEATATAEAGRSLSSPTPTLAPSSTRPATSTATSIALKATPSRTPLFTATRTPLPTLTSTPFPEQSRPTATYTPRPPTSTPEPAPEKTKKPPPNPTRRPPKDNK